MSFENSTIFPASRLTCERCSGHGYVPTGLGRLACLECSAAANSSWIPASQPPICEPNPPASHSITVWGVVVTPDGRDSEKVAYWPARGVWTATRMDGNEPTDVEVKVSHWMYPAPLPDLGAAHAPVDESVDMHRKVPDEIENLHKPLAAQKTWKILPSESGKTRYACPACLGEPAKPTAAFFNTGEDWTKHYQAEVVMQCQVCGGGGLVTAAISQRYFIGRAHRQDRAHRGENMREAAQRLGVTVPQLSAWELGYSDLPNGETLQEPKEQ